MVGLAVSTYPVDPDSLLGDRRPRDPKTLGPKAPDPDVGRDVHHPLYLLREGSGPILVKRCPWVSEARFLADELAQLMSVPVTDDSGEPLDVDETEH